MVLFWIRGAGFVISDLKVQKSFYFRKGFSIFTSELYAIFMALSYICNIPLAIFNILICVDSKSVVLYALQNWGCKVTEKGYSLRNKIPEPLYHIIGIGVELCWVPSHCGLYWNELSDKLGKQGAMKFMSAIACIKLLLSHHEIYSILEKAVYIKISTKINLGYFLAPDI